MAIAIEVARPRDLPAIADDSKILTCELAVPVPVPKLYFAVGVARMNKVVN